MIKVIKDLYAKMYKLLLNKLKKEYLYMERQAVLIQQYT